MLRSVIGRTVFELVRWVLPRRLARVPGRRSGELCKFAVALLCMPAEAPLCKRAVTSTSKFVMDERALANYLRGTASFYSALSCSVDHCKLRDLHGIDRHRFLHRQVVGIGFVSLCAVQLAQH